MFRLALETDMAAVSAIYDQIHTEEEAGRTSIGWVRGVYPTDTSARTALASGDLFVYEENGIILASARINREQMPAYKEASWENNAPANKVMVMHTLAVSPEHFGRGIGPAFVRFYEEYALAHNCPYLRMDTNAQNTRARKLYAGLGYREVGIIPCEFNGIPGIGLVCLEKTLL